MREWAVMKNGEIDNVITTDGFKPKHWDAEATIVPLDQVSLAVKERYRYWNERP